MEAKFKVGDKVKVIGNKFNSINKIGDIGTIDEISVNDSNGLDYRIYVPGREFMGEENISNWHTIEEIELVKD